MHSRSWPIAALDVISDEDHGCKELHKKQEFSAAMLLFLCQQVLNSLCVDT